MDLMKTKKELKEIKRQNIDPRRYMEWTADAFVDWICNMEQGRYSKYEDGLRVSFKKEDICGVAIPYIEKNDWKGWGVESFMDRTNLHKKVQDLITQNDNNVNNMNNNQIAAPHINYNEGGNSTDYI